MTSGQFNDRLSQLLGVEFTWTCKYSGWDYSIVVREYIHAMRTKMPSDYVIAKGYGYTLNKAFESCLRMAERSKAPDCKSE